MSPPKNAYNNKLDTNRKPTKGWLPNDRRIGILEEVWQHGFLTTQHIGWLEGVGRRRAQELVKPLFDNGYLHRPNPKVRAGYPFMFHWLSKRGAKLVAKRLNTKVSGLDWMRRPRWSQIVHDALITDFRIILTKACEREPDFTMQQWIGETTFRSWQDTVKYTDLGGNSATKRIYIDGYGLVVRTDDTGRDFYSRLLVECEISPKTNPRFADDKILPQLAYLTSEIYEKRLGSKSGRVLYIVPTQEKLDNFRRAVRGATEQKDWRIFYFTTYEKVSLDTILFENIWWRPGDRKPVSLFRS